MDLAVLRVSLLHQVSHHSQSWGRDLIGTCKTDITWLILFQASVAMRNVYKGIDY